jgi:hypothetical protein
VHTNSAARQHLLVINGDVPQLVRERLICSIMQALAGRLFSPVRWRMHAIPSTCAFVAFDRPSHAQFVSQTCALALIQRLKAA